MHYESAVTGSSPVRRKKGERMRPPPTPTSPASMPELDREKPCRAVRIIS